MVIMKVMKEKVGICGVFDYCIGRNDEAFLLQVQMPIPSHIIQL